MVVALLAAGGGEWRVGAPAPGWKGSGGEVSVVLDAPMDGAVERLRERGVRVVVRHAAGNRVALVDEAGIVRRIGPAPAGAEELADFVAEWEDGRAVFRNRCARCHGEDGMDTGYPLIRTLGGIGSRYGRDEIKQKIHASHPSADLILILGESFSRKQFTTLLVFLASL